MARIRSGDTTPELAVRRFLHGKGLRFRLHKATLPGRPDVVLARHRTAVFVHGCFWHGHDCKDGRRPRSNTEYWNRKLDRNHQRDEAVRRELCALGWKGVVIWGCETTKPDALQRLIQEIIS